MCSVFVKLVMHAMKRAKEIKVNDNFMAPIFADDVHKGTGAFKLVEWFHVEGSDEVIGGVRVMGASNSKLRHTLEERCKEAGGLVHFCGDGECRF